MICPQCGNETSDELDQCQHCGSTLATGVNWGVRKNTYQQQYSSDTEKLTSFVAANPAKLHKARPAGVKIALGAGAIALVLAMGYGGYTMAQSTEPEVTPEEASSIRAEARTHNVIVSVTAPGLDEGGTLIPVQITGADAAGNAYDEVAFIKADGTGVALEAGKYGMAPLASPISADGNLFLFSNAKKWFSVSSDLEEGAMVDASEDVALVFEPADPSDLNNDAVENAKKYAMESGMSEADVDALLAPLREAMSNVKTSGAFSNTQTYRGTTFVGDVRTNTGYIPVSGVPDVSPIITRTDCFLFLGSTLYYADNSLASDYSASVALHSRNMTTGQESILATDLASQTAPCIVNGQLVYTAYSYGTSLKRIDLATKETLPLNESLGWDFTKLIGTDGSNAIVATSDGSLPQISLVPVGEGEPTTVTLGDAYGNVVGAFDDKVLVAVSDWSSSRIAAYSLDGSQLWETEVEGATQLGKQMVYADGKLCALSSGGTALVFINMENGENKVYDSNVAYLFEVMAVSGSHVYFAGSNQYASYDNYGTALSTYTTYDLNTETGEITDLGAYEAPQDEDLLEQQQNMYWNDTVYYDDTYYDTTTGESTPASEYEADGSDGAGTGDTNTYGLDPTVGDWDANGAYVGNGQGGYDASGNPV